MATITFDQTGLNPAGVTDRARSDGKSDGSTVTITVFPPNGTVEFVDVPSGDTTSVSTLSGAISTWTFDPTPGVVGTWLVQYTDPSNVVVRRAFSARTPVHGLRIPAFNEKASQSATIANGSSYVSVSDDNEGGTYDGWYRSLTELYDEVETGAPNSHGPSHKHMGADEIATATPAANAIPKALASGKLDVGWTSLTQVSTSSATVSLAVNTLLLANPSANAITVNLPASHAVGDKVLIKMSAAATNPITVDPNGVQTIDGQTTITLTTDYEWVLLVSNGSNWFQIG